MAPAALDLSTLIAALEEEDPFCPAPPSDAKGWSEQRVRAWFASSGEDKGEVELESSSALSREELLRKYPPPSQETFLKWFPGLERSKTGCAAPRMRLVCFTNAGNEENVFTNAGLGARSVPVLLDWCRANAVEILAVQLPGRGARLKEPFLETAQSAAAASLHVLGSRLLDGVPYCVLAHSVGTWIAFEMLSLAREQGIPLPRRVFFSSFPAPDLPPSARPWTAQRGLDDPRFKDECRGWDVSEALLKDAAMWSNYVGLMRADFRLFDEYELGRRAGAPPFPFPITTFHADADKKVTPAMVQGWRGFTTGAFATHSLPGHHLFVLAMGDQKAAKQAWLTAVRDELATAL